MPTFSIADAESLGRAAVEAAKKRQMREERAALKASRPEFDKRLEAGREFLMQQCAGLRTDIGVRLPLDYCGWTAAQVGAFVGLARRTFPGFTVHVILKNPERPISNGNPVEAIEINGRRRLPELPPLGG